MTKRIFRSICLAAVGVFLASAVLFMGVLYDYFSHIQKNQLRMQTELAAQGADHDGAAYFEGLDAKDYRITWINTDGTVLYDSVSDTSEMENHLEREEIRQALAEGTGESSRYSVTLMERSLYCAKRLTNGTVLRLSIAQNTLLTLSLGMAQPICAIFIAALLLSLLLASRLSKKIVKPLNELDLDAPLKNDGYDELTPLLRRIDAQQQQIRRQSDELRQKQREFETVTQGMSEGIVLLNSGLTVLSSNPAAGRLLGTDDCAGAYILSLNRSAELRSLLQKAQEGHNAKALMELGESRYQLNASPVITGSTVSGIVLLLLDVTEKEMAEQLRREFSANVSHELKTPLHTISGCAELLAGGVVKPEDVARFSAQIYTEAQRMISLVTDILRLSQLDEGTVTGKQEEVDLYALAEQELSELSVPAGEAGITLRLCGERAGVWGIPELLQSIVHNLCDNAVKYNRRGGSVTVTLKKEADAVSLSVEDTGIGIPPEHQERIFERFYRVDKSRSKEVGGTGLGLSIVKHAARLHNARIRLRSIPGSGTTITVRFPVSASENA